MQATIQRTVRLSPEQAAFRRSGATYKAFIAGIGAGKTYVGAYDLICRAKRGRLYMAVGPTYTVLSDSTIRTFMTIARELGVVDENDVRKSPPNDKLATGAEIFIRSGDEPDRLRGPNLSGAWLDEGALMEKTVYDVMLGRLRERGEQGFLSVTTTPKGLGHWTYEAFGRPKPDTEVFRARTKDNPFLTAEFAASLQRQYGETNYARQELGGEFVSTDGAEWPAEYFDHAAFWFDDWPRNLEVRTLALDPSKGSDSKVGDYSAYVKYGRDEHGIEYVEGDLSNTRDAEEIVDAGIEHIRQFKPDGFAIEGNAFQFLFAPLFRQRAERMRLDLPIYLVDNTVKKVVRIRRLTEPLRNRIMRFRNTPGTRLLVQQLRDVPVGEHDDGPDCLEMSRRLAVELVNGGELMRANR